jgi:hypothetical protein
MEDTCASTQLSAPSAMLELKAQLQRSGMVRVLDHVSISPTRTRLQIVWNNFEWSTNSILCSKFVCTTAFLNPSNVLDDCFCDDCEIYAHSLASTVEVPITGRCPHLSLLVDAVTAYFPEFQVTSEFQGFLRTQFSVKASVSHIQSISALKYLVVIPDDAACSIRTRRYAVCAVQRSGATLSVKCSNLACRKYMDKKGRKSSDPSFCPHCEAVIEQINQSPGHDDDIVIVNSTVESEGMKLLLVLLFVVPFLFI